MSNKKNLKKNKKVILQPQQPQTEVLPEIENLQIGEHQQEDDFIEDKNFEWVTEFLISAGISENNVKKFTDIFILYQIDRNFLPKLNAEILAKTLGITQHNDIINILSKIKEMTLLKNQSNRVINMQPNPFNSGKEEILYIPAGISTIPRISIPQSKPVKYVPPPPGFEHLTVAQSNYLKNFPSLSLSSEPENSTDSGLAIDLPNVAHHHVDNINNIKAKSVSTQPQWKVSVNQREKQKEEEKQNSIDTNNAQLSFYKKMIGEPIYKFVDPVCPICFATNGKKIQFANCGHIICEECVVKIRRITVDKKIMGTRCPFCRQTIQQYIPICTPYYSLPNNKNKKK